MTPVNVKIAKAIYGKQWNLYVNEDGSYVGFDTVGSAQIARFTYGVTLKGGTILDGLTLNPYADNATINVSWVGGNVLNNDAWGTDYDIDVVGGVFKIDDSRGVDADLGFVFGGFNINDSGNISLSANYAGSSNFENSTGVDADIEFGAGHWNIEGGANNSYDIKWLDAGLTFDGGSDQFLNIGTGFGSTITATEVDGFRTYINDLLGGRLGVQDSDDVYISIGDAAGSKLSFEGVTDGRAYVGGDKVDFTLNNSDFDSAYVWGDGADVEISQSIIDRLRTGDGAEIEAYRTFIGNGTFGDDTEADFYESELQEGQFGEGADVHIGRDSFVKASFGDDASISFSGNGRGIIDLMAGGNVRLRGEAEALILAKNDVFNFIDLQDHAAASIHGDAEDEVGLGAVSFTLAEMAGNAEPGEFVDFRFGGTELTIVAPDQPEMFDDGWLIAA